MLTGPDKKGHSLLFQDKGLFSKGTLSKDIIALSDRTLDILVIYYSVLVWGGMGH